MTGDLHLTDVNQLWISDLTYIRLETPNPTPQGVTFIPTSKLPTA